MPLFSIIIPAYNVAATIAETLESIRTQRFRDFEVIVVDDGSTDETGVVVQNYEEVRYLFQQNQGPGSARNNGARYAKGKFLIFLDADDVMFPWGLELYEKEIQNAGNVSLFGGQIFPFDTNEDLDECEETSIRVMHMANYFEAARKGIFVGSCMMGVDRNVFLRSGGFNTNEFVGEDHDLVYRIGTEAGFFFIDRPYIVGYRNVASSLSRNPLKAFHGLEFLYKQYKSGKYKLSSKSNAGFQYVFAQHARANSLALKKNGHFKQAFWLYKKTFNWNTSFLKLKYLIGFWIY